MSRKRNGGMFAHRANREKEGTEMTAVAWLKEEFDCRLLLLGIFCNQANII